MIIEIIMKTAAIETAIIPARAGNELSPTLSTTVIEPPNAPAPIMVWSVPKFVIFGLNELVMWKSPSTIKYTTGKAVNVKLLNPLVARGISIAKPIEENKAVQKKECFLNLS